MKDNASRLYKSLIRFKPYDPRTATRSEKEKYKIKMQLIEKSSPIIEEDDIIIIDPDEKTSVPSENNVGKTKKVGDQSATYSQKRA